MSNDTSKETETQATSDAHAHALMARAIACPGWRWMPGKDGLPDRLDAALLGWLEHELLPAAWGDGASVEIEVRRDLRVGRDGWQARISVWTPSGRRRFYESDVSASRKRVAAKVLVAALEAAS